MQVNLGLKHVVGSIVLIGGMAAGLVIYKNNNPPPITPPPVGSAMVWIDPAGSDTGANCKKAATPGTEPTPSTVCATPATACTKVSAGDTIGIGPGMYPIGFSVPATCVGGAGANIVYQLFGGNAFFQGEGTFAPSYVKVVGPTVGYGVGLTFGRMHVSGTNNTWIKVNSYCQVGPGTKWIQLHAGTSNEDSCNAVVDVSGTGFTWDGADVENQGSCFTSCSFTNTSNNPQDWIIGCNNCVFNHFFVNHWWAMDDNTTGGQHSEFWFLHGGNGITLANSQIINCKPPPSTGYPLNRSCNTSYLFAGQFGGTDVTTDNFTMINDVVDNNSGQGASVEFGYLYPIGTERTLSILYSAFPTGTSFCGTTSAGGCGAAKTVITGVNQRFIGDVTVGQAFSACFSASTYAGNVWYNPGGAAPKCGATDTMKSSTPATSIFTNPSANDYTPLSPLWTAGESTVCLANANPDINGKARPASPTPCTAGPIQH